MEKEKCRTLPWSRCGFTKYIVLSWIYSGTYWRVKREKGKFPLNINSKFKSNFKDTKADEVSS